MKIEPIYDQSRTDTAGERPGRETAECRRSLGGRLKPWQAYGFATVATAATLGLRLALASQLGERPTLIVFTVPIMLSAYLGGLGAGLLATVLSFFGASYYLLPAVHGFHVSSAGDRWDMVFLVLAGVVISALNEALHRAHRRADVAHHEQQQARVAVAKAGILQGAIFNSASFSCIATDAKGVIQIFNVGAERMLGYTSAEVLNKITPANFHDPQEVIARATALSQELGTAIAPGFEALVFKASRGIEDDYELTKIRKDGSRFPAVVSVTALRDASGGIIGYLLIGTDNTARQKAEEVRKRFEQALQETNVKLESARFTADKANLAKSDFLSSMSHELRSPLNAILGFAQLMESAVPPPSASQAKSIAQILHAGWYLLKLINEVLDLAVIESGKLSLSNESVSLSEVMSECQAMMEPQAQQRGIRMTFPRFDDPVYVSADRTRLKQIIINLVSNAIKYNKAQGTVVVDCAARDPERIRISVKDTGAGLPSEKVAQLFQPFNRLGQEAGSVAGTGIGLVMSKRLAELMGGIIGVESTVGVGSVFWCELNSAAAPQITVESGEVEALAQPEAPAGAPRHTLLYVEDNPANMELVEELIGRFPDMGLVTAVNGTLGIELARSTRPQVILMDINLPGISGFKVLKILKEDPATGHIPVIALSANAMPRDVEKGLEAGFFRYLTKPIRIKEFMTTLNAALEFAEQSVVQNN